MEDLYNENCNTLIMKLKTQMNGKIVHVHGLKESTFKLSILSFNMSILSKVTYRFTVILFKVPRAFFIEVEKKNPKIPFMEPQKILSSLAILRKNKARSITISEFKLLQSCHYEKVWYWHKRRHNDQQNRLESPGICVCVYIQ